MAWSISLIFCRLSEGQGTPGEIVGTIDYQKKNRIGPTNDNSSCGIFGTVDRDYLAYDPEKAVPVADPEEVTEATVGIVCTMNGETNRYAAEIRKIDKNNKDHKNFVLQITDEQLLGKNKRYSAGDERQPCDSEWKAGRGCHPCLCQ